MLAVFPDTEWLVSLEFKENSADKFTELTKDLAKNFGEQKLAIVLDEVVSAPGMALDVDQM